MSVPFLRDPRPSLPRRTRFSTPLLNTQNSPGVEESNSPAPSPIAFAPHRRTYAALPKRSLARANAVRIIACATLSTGGRSGNMCALPKTGEGSRSASVEFGQNPDFGREICRIGKVKKLADVKAALEFLKAFFVWAVLDEVN